MSLALFPRHSESWVSADALILLEDLAPVDVDVLSLLALNTMN